MEDIQIRPNQPKIAQYSHGEVAADWSADKATGKARGTDYNFYVTDLSIDAQTDLTSELGTQEVPIRVVVHNDSTSADIYAVTMSVPSNSHISLNSPIMLKVSNTYATHVQLGGATASTCSVYLMGFEK